MKIMMGELWVSILIDLQKIPGSPCIDCERNGSTSSKSCLYTLGMLPPCDILLEFVKTENERRKIIREGKL